MVLCVDGVRRRQIIGLHRCPAVPLMVWLTAVRCDSVPMGGRIWPSMNPAARVTSQTHRRKYKSASAPKFGKKAENRVLPSSMFCQTRLSGPRLVLPRDKNMIDRLQASPKERALGCPPRATRAPRRAHRLVGLVQPGPTKRPWPHRSGKARFFSPPTGLSAAT